eukprot:EG_transcript_661
MLLPAVCRTLQYFTLYETKQRFYLVGCDISRRFYKVLKIERSSPDELQVSTDGAEYSPTQLHELLETIDAANKSRGGLSERLSGYGLLGFIRFTRGYYLVLITGRRRVGTIGPHSVYEITATEMVPFEAATKHTTFSSLSKDDESKYREMFLGFDVTHDFYFSYTYDITHTLQWNVGQRAHHGVQCADGWSARTWEQVNDMFVWNSYLLQDVRDQLEPAHHCWLLPVTHGFYGQTTIRCYGRLINLVIVARRSRFFAGTRYLKRGINDRGFVANHAETEQIVYDSSTASLGQSHGLYTSVAQMRGSVPVYWLQAIDRMPTPKPIIKLGKFDTFHAASKNHFRQIFESYGSPVIVLDLLKQQEKHAREMPLGKSYMDCIAYINAELPPEVQVEYIPWDFRSASKTKAEKVINDLTAIAEITVAKTGFFATQNMATGKPCEQTGVIRTNCVDCLDRTNLAQFFIGRYCLGLQLQAIGIIAKASDIVYYTSIIDELLKLYIKLGDKIALQYGGSRTVTAGLVHRGVAWDMVTNMRRFYSNNFIDFDKQNTINLFLGYYTPLFNERSMGLVAPYTFPMRSKQEGGRRKRATLWQLTRALLMMNPTTTESDTSEGEDTKYWKERGSRLSFDPLTEEALATSKDGSQPGPSSECGSFITGSSSACRLDMHEELEKVGKRIIDLWDLESDYYLHSFLRESDLPPQWWASAVGTFNATLPSSYPNRSRSEREAASHLKPARLEAFLDDVYGGPTTLVTFAEDEAEPTRFRDLETGADFVDCVNTLATPLQDQLAQCWEGKMKDSDTCLTDLHGLCHVPLVSETETNWEELIGVMTKVSTRKARDLKEYHRYCSDRTLVENRAEYQNYLSTVTYEHLTNPGTAVPEKDLLVYNSYSRRALEGMAEYQGDVKAYELYLRPETWTTVAGEAAPSEASSTGHVGEPPVQLLGRFLPYFQPSVKLHALWDDIQELVSDMKTALHTQARIRHMHVAGIIHQPSRSRGELPEMLRGNVYHDSFLGREAITWLTGQCHKYGLLPLERKQAEEFLSLLLEGHVFHHVMHAYSMLDGFFLYRYFHQETKRVLNMAVVQSLGADVVHPVQLSVELLANACKFYRQWLDLSHDPKNSDPSQLINSQSFQSFTLQTTALQLVDFKYLTDPEDWLAFFANLFNTLYIHAIFGIGTVFDMHVHVFANTSCYVVGGYVLSLADIKHGILRGNKRAPGFLFRQFHRVDDKRLRLVRKNFDPRVHFALLDLYSMHEAPKWNEPADRDSTSSPSPEPPAEVDAGPLGAPPLPADLLQTTTSERFEMTGQSLATITDDLAGRQRTSSTAASPRWAPPRPGAPAAGAAPPSAPPAAAA